MNDNLDYFNVTKLMNKDIGRLYRYISDEPEYNLFIYGDVEAYGLEGDRLDIWAVENNGEFDSILMRFNEYYIPYSKNNNFCRLPIINKLKQQKAIYISGKKAVIEKISGGFPDIKLTDTHLARIDKLFNKHSAPGIQKAELKDIEDITRFYCDIEEFDTRNRYQRSLESSRDYIIKGTGRFFYMRINGEIVSVAASTAENSKSAMVVGVATSLKHRGKGYATMVVSELCDDILSEGKEFLCLFYYNPQAGRIYKRIGFFDVGSWTMGENIPKLL